MAQQGEQDFPPGHPARYDYDPGSPEAIEWARVNVHPLGDRDWPVGHPKASDTPGNLNHVTWQAGVDPLNKHIEPFTGRTPDQAAAVRALSAAASLAAAESTALTPVDARLANAALEDRRRELDVETLTEDQTRQVLRRLQEYADLSGGKLWDAR